MWPNVLRIAKDRSCSVESDFIPRTEGGAEVSVGAVLVALLRSGLSAATAHDVYAPKHKPGNKGLQNEVIPDIFIHRSTGLGRVLVGLFVVESWRILGHLWRFRFGTLPEQFKIGLHHAVIVLIRNFF